MLLRRYKVWVSIVLRWGSLVLSGWKPCKAAEVVLSISISQTSVGVLKEIVLLRPVAMCTELTRLHHQDLLKPIKLILKLASSRVTVLTRCDQAALVVESTLVLETTWFLIVWVLAMFVAHRKPRGIVFAT